MSTYSKTPSRTALMLSAGLVALSVVAAPIAASANSAYDEDGASQEWTQKLEQSRDGTTVKYQVVNTDKGAYIPVPEQNAVPGPGPQG